jgi:hypothetical protein
MDEITTETPPKRSGIGLLLLIIIIIIGGIGFYLLTRNNTTSTTTPANTNAITSTVKWNLIGNYNITLTCLTGCIGKWPHAMNIITENNSTGVFTGTGKYLSDQSYTWDVTGTTNGNDVNFTIVYNSNGKGTTYKLVGTIDDNGFMSGTATGMDQTHTWIAVSGFAKKN